MSDNFWLAIRRGWSKHCPHCGKGPLFIGWNKPHRHCPVCGYLYERDYGDVWWVWIVTDRIPIGVGIVFLFFGFRVRTWWMGVLFFGSLALPLLLTIPAAIRPRDRDHLSDQKTLAGPERYPAYTSSVIGGGSVRLTAPTPTFRAEVVDGAGRTPWVDRAGTRSAPR